jgi:hypothetical protein
LEKWVGQRGSKPRVVDDIRSSLKVRIVFTWAQVFIGLVLYAIFWYIFGMMAMQVMGAIDSYYTFLSPFDSTVDLIKKVLAWHPIIAMFGWLLWGILNSTRREPVTYEVSP